MVKTENFRRLLPFSNKILGLLLVMGLMVGVVKYFGKSQITEEVRIEVLTKKGYNLENPANWMNEIIKVGEKEFGLDGKVLVNINKVDSYPQGDDKYKVYLTLEVTGIKDKKTGYLVYKGKPVVVGEVIDIVFEKMKLSGIITHIGEAVKIGKRVVEAEVRWLSQDPWIVEGVRVGDKSINFGNGEVVAEILTKRVEAPSTDIFVENNVNGLISVTKDPKKKDLVMKVRLLVEDDGGVLVYAGHQKIKVGEPLWIYTENIDMEAVEVMNFKETN